MRRRADRVQEPASGPLQINKSATTIEKAKKKKKRKGEKENAKKEKRKSEKKKIKIKGESLLFLLCVRLDYN